MAKQFKPQTLVRIDPERRADVLRTCRVQAGSATQFRGAGGAVIEDTAVLDGVATVLDAKRDRRLIAWERFAAGIWVDVDCLVYAE